MRKEFSQKEFNMEILFIPHLFRFLDFDNFFSPKIECRARKHETNHNLFAFLD